MLIEEVDSDVNLNALEIEPVPEEATNDTEKDSDFEDLQDTEEQSLSHADFVAIYLKRRKTIPRFDQIFKKAPAAILPFLITSNLASFVFFSRYYNGALLEVDPLRLTAILIA
jgi:hypothetical protein